MTQAITLARPYARAAFELAHGAGSLGAWSQAQWSTHAAIGWERITLPASEPVPVYANGVLVGAATQPRMRVTSTQLTIGVQARW